MNLLKRFQKLTSEYQLYFLVCAFVILIGIFWPRPTNFSTGISAHLGNLRGSFTLEAFDTNSQQKTFALFYAPWCGYCKRFMPVWDKFARENQSGTDVNIVKINCDEFKDFAKKAGVTSYPTLKYFSEGLANLDNSEVFKRSGDNGEGDSLALNNFLKSVSGGVGDQSNLPNCTPGYQGPCNAGRNPVIR